MMKKFALIFIACLVSVPVLAADKVYTIFALGYADMEFYEQDVDSMAYKFGLGYQFDPQWYIEAGYQRLINDNLFIGTLPSAVQVEQGVSKIQGDALYLSFLGKASSNVGELFYRLGVLKTDIRGQKFYAGQAKCDIGQGSVVSIDTLGSATICEYDNNGAAAVIGLGFDYFVAARTMVRTEIEFIKGQDILTMTMLTVGLRYNF